VRGGVDHTVPSQLRTVFTRIANWDKVGQRYHMNPFDVGKQFTPTQLNIIIEMINQENIYEKEQIERAKRK